MTVHSIREKIALDAMEPVWTAQGYKVVRGPSERDLPDFLKKSRPDAIAIGREPNLFIKVVTPGNFSSKAKLKQLQELLQDRPDWKIEAVYFGSDDVDVDRTSPSEISGALAKAEEIAAIETRAALLLAWASLEAICRRLETGGMGGTLSPRSLIDFLVSQGFVSQDEGDELRVFADMRNRIAHGQVDMKPRQQDVRALVRLARSIQPLA